MIKKLVFVLALVLASATVANAAAVEKVWICHVTSSETNPYEDIYIAPSAVESQLEQGSYLPMYWYNEEGEVINFGCVMSDVPVPTLE